MLEGFIGKALNGMGKIDKSLSIYFQEMQKQLDSNETFTISMVDIDGKMHMVPGSLNNDTNVLTQLRFKEDDKEKKSILLTDFLAKQITKK